MSIARMTPIARGMLVASAAIVVCLLVLLSFRKSGEAPQSGGSSPTSSAEQVSDTSTAPRAVANSGSTTIPPSTTTTTTNPPVLALEVSVGSGVQNISLSEYGWILPTLESGGEVIGANLDRLVPFVEANDGPFGVTIDDEFLLEHAGADWLYIENGVPVIDRVDATGLCLNIQTHLVLRRSYVSCPTRTQGDSWGYAGTVDDAPAVNIGRDLPTGVTIEHNTITCTGFDGDICGHNIRVGSRGAIIRFNDLSLARSAVLLFDDATFAFNYVHDFAFGFDPARADSATDRVTHNNAVTSLGYEGIIVFGNYIDATYGRGSLAPEENLNPDFPDAFPGGVVQEGDQINGFAFAHYLINGDGSGAQFAHNYINHIGRIFRCNASAQHEQSVCGADISFNVVNDLRNDLFNSLPLFDDRDGEGLLNASCNFEIVGGTLSHLSVPGEATLEDACKQMLQTYRESSAATASRIAQTQLALR